MRIWLAKMWEPLPIDPGHPRLHRACLLAEYLQTRGHHVTFWSSTFDHPSKRHRFETDTHISVSDHWDLRLLHGTGYKRNISFSRVLDHGVVSHKFTHYAKSEPRPDVILSSLPTLDLSWAALSYARARGIPVVIDVRDLWPDIFLDVVPAPLRPAARLALHPLFRQAERLCRHATAIWGITPDFVQWGLRKAARGAGPFDRDFPFGYPEIRLDGKELSSAAAQWKQLGVPLEDLSFTVCFIGAFGERNFEEFKSLIAAARQVCEVNRQFRFVLCGDGPKLPACRKLAAGCSRIHFPGWVQLPQILALMRVSSVGVLPYKSTPDFARSIPNKVVEYLSCGLPIISCVHGLVEDLLASNECGVTYTNGDPEDLASRLLDLFHSPERVRVLSANARRLFASRFRLSKICDQMAGCLEEVVRHASLSALQ